MSEFYIQGALQAKKIGIGKVKGLWNPANFLTKHPKTGTDVRAALPSLGMLGHDGEYKRVNIKVAQVSKQPRTWKPQLPAVAQSLILASCVTGAGAQGWNEVPGTVLWEVYILLALLVAAGFWQYMMWFREILGWIQPREVAQSQAEGDQPVQVMHQDHYLLSRYGNRLHLRRSCPALANSADNSIRKLFTCQVCSEWIVRQPGPSEAAGPRRGGNRQGIPTASQPSPQVEAPEEEPEPHEDDERVDPPSEEHNPYDMNTSEEDTD